MAHCNSRHPVSLVVLAAGLGRRFGGDKQLAAIGDTGRPLMYFSVMDAYRAGLRRLVMVIDRRHEQMLRASFIPMLPRDLEVALAPQRGEDLPGTLTVSPRQRPWGTGHALWCARQAVGDACIVINADDYYGAVAMRQLHDHLQEKPGWAMVAYPLENTLSEHGPVNRGLCAVEQGSLHSIRECLTIERRDQRIRGMIDNRWLDLAPDAPVSMNIWGFDRRIFGQLEQGLEQFLAKYGEQEDPEYYLSEQVMDSITSGQGRVAVYQSREAWFGITYREDLDRVPAALGGPD